MMGEKPSRTSNRVRTTEVKPLTVTLYLAATASNQPQRRRPVAGRADDLNGGDLGADDLHPLHSQRFVIDD